MTEEAEPFHCIGCGKDYIGERMQCDCATDIGFRKSDRAQIIAEQRRIVKISFDEYQALKRTQPPLPEAPGDVEAMREACAKVAENYGPEKLRGMASNCAAAIRALPLPKAKEEGEAGAFVFDRYINGVLMAEGVTIERQTTFSEAAREAARIASRGPNGEIPVLVCVAHPAARPETDGGSDEGHWDTEEGAEVARDYATKKRSDLAMGDMSDFALANAQYMVSRDDLRLIAFQTAAKERIRWLSARLAALSPHKEPEA